MAKSYEELRKELEPKPTTAHGKRQEWLEVQAEDGGTWRLDLGFLMSSYRCIFGNGCPGTMSNGTGCCTFGTPVQSDEVNRLMVYVDKMTEDDHHDVAALKAMNTKTKKGRPLWAKWRGEKDDDSRYLNTQTVNSDGVAAEPPDSSQADNPDTRCVFYSRTEGAEGCAFHRQALRRGFSPLVVKPYVCWVAPFEIHDDEAGHRVLTCMTNDTWGSGTWEPLHWWCTQAPEPYVAGMEQNGALPVFKRYVEELAKILGDDAPGVLNELEYVWTEWKDSHRRTRRHIPVTAVSYHQEV